VPVDADADMDGELLGKPSKLGIALADAENEAEGRNTSPPDDELADGDAEADADTETLADTNRSLNKGSA
jgi:hypothetical protein